jgi:hypothetical protein
MRVMHAFLSAYLLAVSLPVKIDAQKDPVPAILLFAVAAALLWFLITQARRRDARRAGRGRRSDTWSRRPPRY